MKPEPEKIIPDRPPPIRTDPSIKKREMELELLNKFQGTQEQNTEINAAQRVILTSLEQVAKEFMPLSATMSTNKDKTFWELAIVHDFINWFRVYGVPVGRKGRIEVAEVMKSYFEALREESKADMERSRMLR